MPHHQIFPKYSLATWLPFLRRGKRFFAINILPHGQGFDFKTHKLFSFENIYLLKWWFKIVPINLGVF
jgi:hypothetical protein